MGLEIIRFFAAVAILFWHYQHFWSTPTGLPVFVRSSQPLYKYFSFFYEFGLDGVQLFWEISGYIFFWKYRQAVAEHCIGPKTFFMLRFSRLYPLHLATLLLVAALQMSYVRITNISFVYGQNNWFHFMLQLCFASNWGFGAQSSFNGPIWSISIEVLVYFLFFIVLRYLGSRAWLNIAIVVVAAIAYLLTNHNAFFQCVVCFYAGGLGAIMAGSRLARDNRRWFLWFSIATLAAVAAAATLVTDSPLQWIIQLLVVPYITIVLYVTAEHIGVPMIFEPVVRTAGNMTYSSYLIHFPLQLMIAIVCAALGVGIPAGNLGFFVSYMATVLLLAGVLYRFFELPSQAFLRHCLAPARRES